MSLGKAVALLTLSLALSASFAENAAPAKTRVALEVSTQDEDAGERVAKYVRNELRGLGDVVVVSDDPDYKLFVVLTEMRAGGGRIAYVLTMTATSFFPEGYFDTIVRTDLSNSGEVLQRLDEVPVYERQFVSLAGPKEGHLIQTVTSSIANFNKFLLEPRRQGQQ